MADEENENPSQPDPEKPETAEETCQTAGWANVHSAADAIRMAKEEVHKAQEACQKVRREAAERVEAVRNTTVGDLLERGPGHGAASIRGPGSPSPWPWAFFSADS